MTPAETARALAVAQAFDRRTVGEADVAAWHSALEDLPFEDVREAVVEHYRHETRQAMPADVRRHARAIRNARASTYRGLGGGALEPMPSWFRSTVAEFARRAARRRREGPQGQAPRLGDGYSTAVPDHAQRAAHDLDAWDAAGEPGSEPSS